MKNFDVQMDREANASSVTTREFASDNNVNVLRLRGLLKNDDTITATFTRNRVHYYKLETLTNWLKKNAERFNGVDKKVRDKASDFFCTRDTVYKPIALRRKNGCCVDCREKARNRVISDDKDVGSKHRVHASRVRIDNIKDMRALEDDITEGWMKDDSWMYE